MSAEYDRHDHYDSYDSRKRSRSRSISPDRFAHKRPHLAREEREKEDKDEMPYLVLRCLVDTRDAAVLIGRQGLNIARIRQTAGTKLNISNSLPSNPERVVTVSGKLDAVSKAFGLVVRTLNDEDFDEPSLPGSKAVTLRFTIPNMKMGFIIGRSGARIKEIQEASGAKLSTSDYLLPNSTERLLSIDGVADAIHIAVYHVGGILADNTAVPSRERSRRRPSTGSPYGGPSTSTSYSNYPGYPASYGASPYANPVPPVGGGGYPAPPPAVDTTSQRIYVPNNLVGGLIGRGGSKINEIRYISQCSVKILEPGEGGEQANGPTVERLVVITGAPNGIQTAIHLLSERIEKEKEKDISYRPRPRSPVGDRYSRGPSPPI